MASTYLQRTPSSASNRKTWTWSGWVKRSKLGADQDLFNAYNPSGFWERFYFNSSDYLYYDHDISGTDYTLQSQMVFRDTNAWYHLVFAKDTTQSTEADRLKIYVNGVQIALNEVALGYPTQNYDGDINSTLAHSIGAINSGAYFNGSMSHVHFIDGTAYDASAFGSTDANGVWTINTSPSVTYGTNGFFILKDGNSVTDQSGNGNNFTVAGGTLTNTEDNPSNVFATMNPLTNFYQNSTFSNGNNRIVTTNDGVYNYNESTLGMSSGKYYMEVKYITSARPTSDFARFGIVNAPSNRSIGTVGYGLYEYGYYSYNGKIVNNNLQTVYGDTFTDNDIIGIAVDLDNNKLYFSKNGVLQNSGDPTSYATGTGAISITPASDNGTGFYFFAGGEEDGTYGVTFETNFGNGYFGTTAVASAGTNASGNGIFEYDVPTGYTALSTKGLNL